MSLVSIMYCCWAPERIRSFCGYPGNAAKSALLLSEAGFVYVGDGYSDEVKCVSCGFRKEHWKFDEDILHAHLKASKSCPFVVAKATSRTLEAVGTHSGPAMGASYSPRDRSADAGWCERTQENGKAAESSRLSGSTGPENTFVIEIGEVRAASTRYASKIARRKSFDNWTSPYPINKDKMALAGLYATGVADCTRCFSCGGGIKDWEADDDPWVEHLMLLPTCKYVTGQISKELYDTVMVLKRTNPGKISRSMVKRQKRVARQQGGEQRTSDEASLREEHAILTRRTHCRRCHVNLVGADAVVFQPCGHFIVCAKCDRGDVCAECGQHIESRLRACLVEASAVRNGTGC